jgi:hypothetical protein
MQPAAQNAPESLDRSQRYFIRKKTNYSRHLSAEALVAMHGDSPECGDQPNHGAGIWFRRSKADGCDRTVQRPESASA